MSREISISSVPASAVHSVTAQPAPTVESRDSSPRSEPVDPLKRAEPSATVNSWPGAAWNVWRTLADRFGIPVAASILAAVVALAGLFTFQYWPRDRGSSTSQNVLGISERAEGVSGNAHVRQGVEFHDSKV